MNELLEMYQELGISPAVYHRGRRFGRASRRFEVIDQVAEYNQGRSCTPCSATGVCRPLCRHHRLRLRRRRPGQPGAVYADVFHTEAALVRPRSPAAPMPSPWPSPPTSCLEMSCCPCRWTL